MGASPGPRDGKSGEVGARDEVGPDGDDALAGGRYRLRERLGAQDESLIWRAADEALNRPVMVWTFGPGSRRAGAVIAAAREACQLADPRLALILDADDEGDFPYVVAEWPPGRPLGELLAAGPGEPAGAAAMVAEAAGALTAAHAFGLAHLRLEPSSLWLGDTGEVMIIGLGIAAALAGAESSEPALTDTRGLGKLLYAALTGYWPGTEETSLPAAPRDGDRVYRPRQIRAGIPGRLDALTCRALALGAQDRGPAIVDPARLADELMEAAATYPQRGHAAVGQPAASYGRTRPQAVRPTARSTSQRRATGAAPSFTPRSVRAGRKRGPVSPAQWSSPPPGAREPARRAADPRRPGSDPSRGYGHPVTATGGSPPTEPMPRPRGSARRARTLLATTLALAVVALLAVGGWSLAHHGIGEAKGGLGSQRVANPAQGSADLARGGRWMHPVSAQAFNPSGESDNNQLALLAIDRDLATAWQTEWYTTPLFGNLKPGTGLLLDMGRVVTITGARILLGSTPGASFQLRAGMSAGSLQSLPVLAGRTGARGLVSIRLSTPVHARYVLVWFTRLPPDPSGTFRASVFDVRLDGSR